MSPEGPRVHETRLRVRTYECDEYGHVNNAVYLNYLEHARVEYLDAVGFPYRELRAQGLGVVITAISIRYLAELLPGDEVVIRTTPVRVGNVSGTFRQEIFRGDRRISEATVEWAFVGPDGTPRRLSEDWARLLGRAPRD